MRINLNTAAVISESQAESRAQKSPAARSGPIAVQASESQFAASHANTNSLAATALAAPEVRSGKVEALKAQVQAGTYQVSSQQIAASLLDQLRAHS